MKTCMIVLIVLAVSAGFAYAVGSKEGAMEEQLVIASYASAQSQRDAFAGIVSTFQTQNPEIKVTVNTTASEQFKPLFPTWLASDDPPDVATWFAGYRMQQYAAKGLLQSLPESIFPGGSMTSQYAAAFKDASSYNGKIYILPMSWYWWAVYYNKEVFQDLNLQSPTTWQQFLDVCAKLKAAGKTPITIGAKDTWTMGGWFDAIDSAVNGGDFHKELTGGTVPYTDTRVKNALNYLVDLTQNGYVLQNATSYSWQEAAAVLFRGDAGMCLMGQFIKDVAPDDVKPNIDFFKFPTIGGNTKYAVDTPIDGYVVPAHAKNKNAAMKFMSYLAQANTQEAFTKPLGRLAANVTVPVPNEDAQRGLDMVKGATWAMQFYDRDSPEEMASRGLNAFLDILANPGNMDRLFADLDKERKRIYAQQP